jgi:hypothetical protein
MEIKVKSDNLFILKEKIKKVSTSIAAKKLRVNSFDL